MKVPYMLVVGRREAEQGTVAVNVRGAGKEQKPNSVPLDEFVRGSSRRIGPGHWCSPRTGRPVDRWTGVDSWGCR